MKKHILSTFIAITLTPVLIGLQGCSEPMQVERTENVIRPVKTYTVSDQQRFRIASFPGVVQSNNLKEISFVATGRIIEFPIRAAMTVKEGDVLARLDQRELKNQLSQARSQYGIVEDEYQRLLKLSKTGAVSKSSLQAKKVERDVARVQLDSAKEALEDSILIAPFDGVIAQTFVEKDQVVSGGQTLAILIGEGDLEADIDIPAQLLSTLHYNSLKGEVSSSVVSLDSNPSVKYEATFKEATLVADSATQTYGLTFSFTPPQNALVLPGMNVTVEINDNQGIEFGQLIPIDAIASDINGTYVWKVDEDSMTVKKQYIELSDAIGDYVPAIEGVDAGDKIVQAGVSQLSEGAAVREWQQN